MFDPGLAVAADREAQVLRAEARVVELMGVINAAHGELAATVADVVDRELWSEGSLASPSQWLAYVSGMSLGRCRDVVRLVQRRTELPAVAAAVASGALTLDKAAHLTRHVPAGYDRNATELACTTTELQLRRTLPHYGWGNEPTPTPLPDEPSPERSVSCGTDDQGWWLRARLPAAEGAVVERALRAHHDDLYRQANADLFEGDQPVRTTNADALLSMGETTLQAGEARFPGTDRYLVHAHLDANPTSDLAGGPAGTSPGGLSLHWGPALPDAVRRQLLCNSSIITFLEHDGIPVSVGRKTRTVTPKLARCIERRDDGCAVPGCSSRLGTEIHHITHWEDGGPTDTSNLLCLCRRHHQRHHQGLLGIAGNPDLASGHPDALTITDRSGKPLRPTAPTPRPPHAPAEANARRAGITPGTARRPTGERLDRRFLHLAPNPGHPAHAAEVARNTAAEPARAAAAAAAWARNNPDCPQSNLLTAPTDPTRAGPTTR